MGEAIDRFGRLEAMVDAGGGRFRAARNDSRRLGHVPGQFRIGRSLPRAHRAEQVAVELDRQVDRLVQPCAARRRLATRRFDQRLHGRRKPHAFQHRPAQRCKQTGAKLP